jgi:hypothetical protein
MQRLLTPHFSKGGCTLRRYAKASLQMVRKEKREEVEQQESKYLIF